MIWTNCKYEMISHETQAVSLKLPLLEKIEFESLEEAVKIMELQHYLTLITLILKQTVRLQKICWEDFILNIKG